MTNIKLLPAFCAVLLAAPVIAEDAATAHGSHGSRIFHAFKLDADWTDTDKGHLVNWDAHGWIGGDVNKFAFKSEGAHHGKSYDQAELWGLYSRNISEFWDAQIGIREDFIPEARSYLTLGMDGMLPYFIETEAHAFVSDLGDVSARVKGHLDLNITQRLVTQPHVEFNFFAQPVPEKSVKAGLANVELGLQTRYELTRKFAPYFDLNYERLVGATARRASSNGEDEDSFTVRVGLKIWF